MHRYIPVLVLLISFTVCTRPGLSQREPDYLRQMQFDAVENKSCTWARWGDHPSRYSSWTNHSNRLVPIYTFGLTLARYTGENSPYRDEQALRSIYGYVPDRTVDPQASYMDQTQVYSLQKDALAAGKKHIFLILFDGMDWQTTQAAAIYRSKRVGYEKGYGSGLAFLDYDKCPKDAGDFVCSPHNTGTKTEVDSQTVTNIGGDKQGGYSAAYGGYFSWSKPPSESYLLGKFKGVDHVYTDSAASATSMTTGAKTYVSAINVEPDGNQLTPIARVAGPWFQDRCRG